MSLKSFLHLPLTVVFVASSLCVLPARAQVAPAQPAATTQDDLPARVAAIAKVFDEKRQETGVPGASLVVVLGDRVVLLTASGVRDAARNLPATPDTLFAIGSCTKAFTAMTAVMSQDDGKLSLDDSPKKYLPYFHLSDPDADARVTLRDLLSHQTGLGNTDIAWYTGVLNREEVIRVAGRAKPTARLREKFQYQNVMYSAAGETVAHAQGTTWENLVSTRILKPLGMTKTVLTVREMQSAPDYSLGYEYDAATKRARMLPTRDLANIAPAGAINSSAREMAEWLKFLVAGGVAPNGKRLVSEKGFNEILTPQIRMNETTSYALGWGVAAFAGRKVYVHNGGIDGFGAQVAFLPQEKIAFAVLANVESTPLLSIMTRAVVTNLLGASPQTANANTNTATTLTPAPAATTATTTTKSGDIPLKELVGAYELQPGMNAEVSIKNGKVVLTVPDQPDYPLVERERDVLYTPLLPDTYSLRVRRDAAGKVTGMIMRQPEGELELKRVGGAANSDKPLASTNNATPASNSTATPASNAAASPATNTAATTAAGAPLAVEELMSKMLAAAGGEENLRKHKSMKTVAAVTFEHQGLEGEATTYAQAPAFYAREVSFLGLGKLIGTTREFFDGATGGEEMSFSTPAPLWGAQKIAEMRAAADFYAPLDWKSLYQKVEVKSVTQESGEDAYVVVYTPERGLPTTEYVSTKTFLVLRRDTFASSGGDPELITARFSDYHNVGGILVPFTVNYDTPGTGTATSRVREVKFDAPIPADTFKPRAQKP